MLQARFSRRLIDLDHPRELLARQSDLVIPEGARIGQIRIVRRPIFDVSDPEQDNVFYRSLNMDFQDALLATESNYASYGFSQSGTYRLDDNRVENLLGTLSSEYFHGGSVQWNSWYTTLSFTAAHNLTADQNLLIGGDNGLRGYPSEYQQGNRRVLWTLERRYFPDWYPFKLFRLGGVLFTDVGRAWIDDGRNNGPDDGVLKDVGFGLRLASSRIEVQRILHLDFAFPLDGDDSIDEVQVLLRGRAHF